jgi:hypothetical protein
VLPDSRRAGTEKGILLNPGEAITQTLSLSESLRESVALAVTDSLRPGTETLVAEWNEGWERYDWESTRWCQWGHLIYEQRMSEPGERREVITDQLGICSPRSVCESQERRSGDLHLFADGTSIARGVTRP